MITKNNLSVFRKLNYDYCIAFSGNGYISIDFLNKDSEKYEIIEDEEQIEGLSFINFEGKSKKLIYESKNNQNRNALYDELFSFYQSIKYGEPIMIDEKQGVEVFRLAHQIQSLI
jgi:hypothetical protein